MPRIYLEYRKYLKFWQPKTMLPILYFDLKKDPKMQRNDPYIVQYCHDPKEISTKSSYPKNIYFSENQKNIEF